jgi:hypothetical protein
MTNVHRREMARDDSSASTVTDHGQSTLT